MADAVCEELIHARSFRGWRMFVTPRLIVCPRVFLDHSVVSGRLVKCITPAKSFHLRRSVLAYFIRLNPRKLAPASAKRTWAYPAIFLGVCHNPHRNTADALNLRGC